MSARPPLVIKLYPAEQRCLQCGEDVPVLNASPHAYGTVHFATAAGELAAIDALDTLEWDEVTALVDRVAGRLSLDRTRRDALHRDVMERAIDPAPSRSPWGMWGKFPCPRCGGRERSGSRALGGTAQYTDHTIPCATWTMWSTLSPAARQSLVDQLAAPASRLT